MRMIVRRALLKFCILFLIAASVTPSFRAAEPLPSRIGDDVFWRMVSEFSEEGGYFRFDNFLSNELGFQFVIPTLREITKSGGAYLGVGPEQNFTYITALQPKIAFIIDIRRQNMLEHMMYKALFEMSADRADFLTHLYSRKRPGGLNAESDVEILFAGYAGISPDLELAQKNIAAIKDILVNTHKFDLSKDDLDNLEYVYRVFVEAGPDLDYTIGGGGGGGSPTYEQLMSTTDKDGHKWSYLASEEHYRVLREMEMRNLIVPLVGNFAGPRAIRTVAQYLSDHDSMVTTFYLSNVEQYLFQQGDEWRRFYRNVATLPLDASSTFIRSVNGGANFGGRFNGYMRFQSLLSPMQETVTAFEEGRVRFYNDVIRMSK